MIKVNIKNRVINVLIAILDLRRQQQLEKASGLNLGKAVKLKKQLQDLYNELNDAEQAAINSLMTEDEPKAWLKYLSDYCAKHPNYEKLFELIDEEHFFFLPREKWFKPHTARHIFSREGAKQYPDWYQELRGIDNRPC